ncbi:hypothetical protein Ddye_030991 [Dipteronia dyeriana]|uniref:Uncharacterized protein n=1 Tax=Dipteronia dyeriana TaxID=168575 RepID=A0AAD9TIF3_9ROSI|nr:hypothetical protein Ddye_030991 [Dipteronia dyeriana]
MPLDSNMVADGLAKFSSLDIDQFWIEDCPSCVVPLVSIDLLFRNGITKYEVYANNPFAQGSHSIYLAAAIKLVSAPSRVSGDFVKKAGWNEDNPCISVFANTMPAKKTTRCTPPVTGIADDFRFIIQTLALPICVNASKMPIAAKIALPTSKGKLELNKTEPRQNASVIINYLVEEKDLGGM